MKQLDLPVFGRLLKGVNRVLLAPRCLVCSESGSTMLDLCPGCINALPWNRTACGQCGLPLALAAAACGQCLKRPPAFTHAHAIFRYDFPVDRLLPRFKFHSDLAAGALLGTLMTTPLAQAQRPDALVPVPLHRTRLRERGYDQALELAKLLAQRLQIPLQAALLVRNQAAVAQSRLGALARRRNVRGAFACAPAIALPAHVALVDDVMTTGSTVRECAKTLRRAGVAQVDIWVLARASVRIAR